MIEKRKYLSTDLLKLLSLSNSPGTSTKTGMATPAKGHWLLGA
jgi:hypothetical protein